MNRTTIGLALAGAVLIGGPAVTAQAATGPNVTCAKSSVTSSQSGLASFASSTSGKPCTVQLSSWSVPDTYDGKGYDASAKPQKLFDRTVATLTGTPSTVAVKLPPSHWCQIDYRAADGTYIYGRIVECHPTATVTPKPPITNCAKGTHKSHGKCVATATRKPSEPVADVVRPAQLAYTASPFDLSKYVEGGVGALLLGALLTIAVRKPAES